MVEMLKPDLEEVRASGSTFYDSRVHPRKWDRLVTEGESPPFSTLYISEEILRRMGKERGRRWKLKPRFWDRKNRRWTYRVRHKPHLDKEDFKDSNWEGKKVRWMWYTQEQWENREVRNLNGVPHGNAYKVRREAWRVLNDFDEKRGSAASRVLKMGFQKGYSRGNLVRVTVSMPDLSLAIAELFLDELLPEIKKGELDSKAVFLVLPTRGPGSGDIKQIFQEAILGEVEEDEIKKVVSKSWRSIITKFIELHCLYRWDKTIKQNVNEWGKIFGIKKYYAQIKKEDEERIPPPLASPNKEIKTECSECNSRSLDYVDDFLYCVECGYVLDDSVVYDDLSVRCFICGKIGHTSVICHSR
jgi:hypothetical protein